jgi:ABC-type uncharacterized transport system substrate-binding protein
MNRVRRRFIGRAALAPLLTSPLAAFAMERRKRVVSFNQLDPNDVESYRGHILGWFGEQGFVEGGNLAFAVVNCDGVKPDDVETKARATVASRPDLILTTGTRLTLVLQRHTRDIPVVFFNVGDPVVAGLVESLRRPGRNITGASNRGYELFEKRFELLKEIQPRARRIAVLSIEQSPSGSMRQLWRQEMASASARLGFDMAEVVVSEDARLDAVTAAIRSAKADGVIYGVLNQHLWMPDMLDFLRQSGLPAVFMLNEIVAMGGLASIGEPIQLQGRRAVAIAARILRGEKPATIPVDQLSTPHLAINLRTARAMRLAIPDSVRLRADEVVE